MEPANQRDASVMGLVKPQAGTPEGLRATTITDTPRIAAIREAWRSLWRSCPRATPFQSPDWLEPWWDVFAPGELRIVAVYRGGDLVGLAPLYQDGMRLLPVGISLSDYQDVLVNPEYADGASEAIGESISAMDGVEVCEFDELPPDALALQIGPRAWDERLRTASPCPLLKLPGSARELTSFVSPSRLRHLRTARRRVARRGDGAIIEGDIDNAVSLFRELVRLHRLRWQADSRKGVFTDPRVEAFHMAALPGLIELGIVRLYALTIGDAITGVYYGFLHKNRAYAYIGGYDPDFAFESPGSVLLGHAIEEAVREGATVFDFLRGSEDYKYEWGAQDRWNVRLTLRRRGGIHG